MAKLMSGNARSALHFLQIVHHEQLRERAAVGYRRLAIPRTAS
jgi:hypothetical protein